jgi:hypothetical protein
MTVGELIVVLSRLDPTTEVHVAAGGPGAYQVGALEKRGRWKDIRRTPTGRPLQHNAEKNVTISAGWPERLWFVPPGAVRLTGRWPTKVKPLAERIDKIERSTAMAALASIGDGRG